MKRNILIALLIIVCIGSNAQPNQQQRKTKVMILGVFHFASNNDALKFEKENMLSNKRQKEIEDLNMALMKFKPDKIFIEWEPTRQKRVDSLFKEYKKGSFNLTANEIYQIGFKMALKLGHHTVYCMDGPGDYLYDTVLRTAKKYGQEAKLNDYYNDFTKKALAQDSLHKMLTVKERLRRINQKEFIMESHYANAGVVTAPYIGEVGEYAASEFMGEWYKRNIRMYSNIVRTTASRDEAILIIVGLGHARILRHLFEDNPYFEIINAEKYLSK